MKINTSITSSTLPLALGLILLGFAARLLPHPVNFAPISAIALFGGLYLPKRLALALPLVTMLLSDLVIGFYNPRVMIAVYISFVIVGLIGLYLRNHKNIGAIIGGTLFGSIIFFLVTNAAVWMFGTMYSHDMSGLMTSYARAIPFFRNSLAGDIFFTGMLVGSYELLARFFAPGLERKKV